jgi:hypothetical protein
MYHYVYKLEHIETGEFYIGSRSSKKHPSLDNYLGSMKVWNPDKTKLKKIILKDDFLDRESAIIFESEEISFNIKNILNRNYHIPSSGYHTHGTVTTKDKNGNIFQVHKEDYRYLNGELVGVTTGSVTVKDKNNNTQIISINDPRYLNGEMIHIHKNMATLKDENGKIEMVSIDDPRYLNGTLVGINKGKVLSKDENGKIEMVSIDDPRYLNGELNPIWVGRKHNPETKRKIGETNSIRQRGENNSQFGTCWITKDDKNKKIKKEELDDYIKNGWIKGRKIKV